MKLRTLALLPALLIAATHAVAEDGGDRLAARQQALLAQAREAAARKNTEALAIQNGKTTTSERLPSQAPQPEQSKN